MTICSDRNQSLKHQKITKLGLENYCVRQVSANLWKGIGQYWYNLYIALGVYLPSICILQDRLNQSILSYLRLFEAT